MSKYTSSEVIVEGNYKSFGNDRRRLGILAFKSTSKVRSHIDNTVATPLDNAQIGGYSNRGDLLLW